MKRSALPHGSAFVALAAVIAASACSTSPAETVTTIAETQITTAAPAETTAASQVTTTVVDAIDITLVLDRREQLATRGGVSIAVEVGDARIGRLDAMDPTLDVSVEPGTSIGLRYVASGGSSTDVTWVQEIGSATETVVQPWRRDRLQVEPHVVAWQTADDRGTQLSQLDRAATLTATSPVAWTVGEDGGLVGGVDAGLVAEAHDRGIAVWPAVQSLDAGLINALVSDPGRRSAAAAAISADAAGAGADGVNIDIEGYRSADAASVTAFVEELAGLVRAWGGVVSLDLVPRSDTWDVGPADLAFWSTAPERRSLVAAVDYTVLMAYDQYNRFRPAGPVAAPAWVEEVLVYMLRYADPESVLLGLPAYGRIWDEQALDEPRAVSMGYLDGLDGERSWDPEFEMDRIDIGTSSFFWVDNEVEAERVSLAEEYGLAGWAVWRLGLDDAGLWEEFAAD